MQVGKVLFLEIGYPFPPRPLNDALLKLFAEVTKHDLIMNNLIVRSKLLGTHFVAYSKIFWNPMVPVMRKHV